MRIKESMLEKYDISVEDGMTYIKSFTLATTESEGIDIIIGLDDLYPTDDFAIQDGDTIIISPFGRASKDPDLYGFFVYDEDDKYEGELGVYASLDEYPCDSYEMYEHVGKVIAGALKNEGYKNVSIVLNYTMSDIECERYLAYCESLGNDKEAIKYTEEGSVAKKIFRDHKLLDSDVLIRFRPQDLIEIVADLEHLSNELNVGGLQVGQSYLKGFVYLNKGLEYEPVDIEEIKLNDRYTTNCPSNGLYLCLDSTLLGNDPVVLTEVMNRIDRYGKAFDIGFLVTMGNLKYTEDKVDLDKCAKFMNRDTMGKIYDEITADRQKYKANFDVSKVIKK